MFITAKEVFSKLKSNQYFIMDGSWHLNKNKNAFQSFLNQHLPTGHFLDLDKYSDQSTKLPHMLPTVEQFQSLLETNHPSAMIKDKEIIVYDDSDVYSSFRWYFMWKVFGRPVRMLEGGLKEWLKHGFPVESGKEKEETRNEKDFVQLTFEKKFVKSYQNIIDNLSTKQYQVVDARSKERFMGLQPEPRLGLPSGHIPHSFNLPFTKLLDQEKRTLLPPEELKQIFIETGLDLKLPMIFSCGSGVTACILFCAAEKIGVQDISVYDGSWAEYASKPDSPIEKSE